MSRSEAAWLKRVDLAFVDRRFGVETVNRVLDEARDYVAGPRADAAGKLLATMRAASGPLDRGVPRAIKVAVRARTETELEMACECSSGRSFLCPHVIGLLIDVATDPDVRAAIARDDGSIAGTISEIADKRRAALEARTLEERLAHWLPPRAFEDGLELDVEIARLATPGAEDTAAVLLRHRRSGAPRVILRPRDVVAARLPPAHRRLVELTAPSHLHKDALVATRAQASLLIHLLRERMHVFTRSFKERLQFASSVARPKIEREGERLVARWATVDGRTIADTRDTLLFAGPFPFLWCETEAAFYEVAPDVDLDLAAGLARVPSLPLTPETSSRVGRALLVRSRGLGVALPKAEELGLPPLEKPSFILRLSGTPLEVEGELSAVYRAGTFPLTASGAEDGERDVEVEERAMALVRDAGLSFDARGALRATNDTAVDLWRRGLARLHTSEDPHFEVLASESLAKTKIGPAADVQVHVDSASGWLETEIEFRVGAIAVELATMRAAIAAGRRWVELRDGTLSEISEKVAYLVGEASSFDEGGHGRLPLHQIGRVERWVERFGGGLSEDARTLRARLRRAATPREPELPSDLRAELRPYQRDGVAWLQLLREIGAGGVLADDMGLGKTLMVLAFLARWRQDAGSAPSLVVCPTSLVSNWGREAERFTPSLRVVVLDGSERARWASSIEGADLVVVTYGLLRRGIEELSALDFRAVVLDEAQNVKNASAATTQAAARLEASMVLALSGTPIENRLGELWSIMDLVNPGMLGDLTDFEDRFDRAVSTQPDGELVAALRATVRPFILRRTKAEVLTDLPDKTEVDRICILDSAEKRSYDALTLAVRESVKKKMSGSGLPRVRISVLTAILRLRQMACDPRLIEPSSPGVSAKRAAFLELVRELVREGRRALVFSQFVELLTLWRADLEREKVAYEYLDGSSTDRAAIVERFQTGDAPLFLISLKAGGAGLNLTAADTVIHCDPWWNPAVEDQATDRAHRIGQARAVTVIRLFAEGTIEEKIGLLKSKKRELALSVLGGDGGDFGRLEDEDLRILFGDEEEPSKGAVDAPEPEEEEAPPPERRFVTALEIDELRAIAKTVIRAGMPKTEFARRVRYPMSRLALLLIGHRVPITGEVAERIRALRFVHNRHG